jgi:hypothetical protein
MFLESIAMDMTSNWPELVRHPNPGDHMVQVYQDPEFLTEVVSEYIDTALRRGEAAIVIARPEHWAKFFEGQGQLKLLDAEETLARIMTSGMPEWKRFHEILGGAIADLQVQYPRVRAYGEMADVLWQRGDREAALRLEDYWNELGRLQSFSRLCAYHMDLLDSSAYGGPLECVCKAHTHLIPVRDYNRFNEAVSEASKKILDRPLAQMLLSLSANHRPATHMPLGQATLLWLKQNMPRTADKVLSEVRARWAPA